MFLHFSCYGKELLHNFLKFLSFSFCLFSLKFYVKSQNFTAAHVERSVCLLTLALLTQISIIFSRVIFLGICILIYN